MQKTCFKIISKYKRLDNLILKNKKKVEILYEERIRFKPQIKSVYKKFNHIQPYTKSDFNISKPGEPEYFLYKKPTFDINKTPTDSKVIKIALYGPTNSGKSQLMNKIVKRIVSPVSDKQFTT